MAFYSHYFTWLGAIAALASIPEAHAQNKLVAYVPNWIELAAFSAEIDYGKVTHLNVAFENPTDDTGTLSFNPQDAVLVKNAHAHSVKILVSIGGGSASQDKVLLKRYAVLLGSSKRRAVFVKKISEYLAVHAFDGLDVDLEGPGIGDDYGSFIHDLAATLRPRGKLLTAALSQGYGGSKVPTAALGEFDFVNIMAYDATGDWDPKSPGQHSSLEFAKANVAYWLQRGLPRSKAVLGVPFYGYGFGEAFRKRDYPFAAIVTAFPGAENRDQAGKTIWYNGAPTIRAKVRFATEERLGGIMIWSLDDDAKGKHSLLTVIHETLKLKSSGKPSAP